MSRYLPLALFFTIATPLMGICVTASLAMGKDTAQPIEIAALVGFVLALPATWIVARKLTSYRRAP